MRRKKARPQGVADRPHGADQGTRSIAEPVLNADSGHFEEPIQARLGQIKRQLTKLEEALLDLTRQCAKRARAFDILCSIPGFGRVTAIAILIEYAEIGTMERKQIAILAGLAPMTRQSGQWRGKAVIQGGRKFLSDALHMPALVVVRDKLDLREKYQTMIQAGKPAKFALTALVRKLIEMANALVRQDREWTPKAA